MYPDVETGEYTQDAAGMETPPFESGVGGAVGGEVHIDGTPMRAVTFAALALLLLVAYNSGAYRFHVTV